MSLFIRMLLCFFVWGVLFMPLPALAATGHTVLPGESLYTISRNYNVSVASLMEANGIRDHLIYPGQRLSVPGGPVLLIRAGLPIRCRQGKPSG
ncbi:MAG: LysM peptidoglycan-binding domain-containing protein [Candidatus Syntrophopropionicum ammoniitolerans]